MLRLLIVASLSLLVARPAQACDPAPRPLCARTAWLGSAVEGPVAVPGSTVDLRLPIALRGALLWEAGAAAWSTCAHPTALAAAVEVVCSTADGVELHRSDWSGDLALPTGPGILDLSALEAQLEVPAGALTEPATCAVEASVDVAFEPDKLGTGTVEATVHDAIDVLERSPVDPALPRLDVRRLVPANGADTARAGDEVLLWFAVENRDGERSVDVSLSLDSAQRATEPGGEDPDGLGFALGGPSSAALDLAWADDATSVDIGDPTLPGPDSHAGGETTLGPGEAAILSVIARSWATCPDAAASTVELRATADFGDGPVGAHASALLEVGVATPRSPRCEIVDRISSAPTVDGTWGPATIDGDWELRSHPAGTLPQQDGGPATRVPGFSFAEPYPNPVADAVRSPRHPSSVAWAMDLVPTQTAAAWEPQHVEVSATHLDAADVLNLPAIYDSQVAASTGVALDAAS